MDRNLGLTFECVLGWMFIYIPFTSKLTALQLSVCEGPRTVLPRTYISITIHRIQHNKVKAVGSLITVYRVQNR